MLIVLRAAVGRREGFAPCRARIAQRLAKNPGAKHKVLPIHQRGEGLARPRLLVGDGVLAVGLSADAAGSDNNDDRQQQRYCQAGAGAGALPSGRQRTAGGAHDGPRGRGPLGSQLARSPDGDPPKALVLGCWRSIGCGGTASVQCCAWVGGNTLFKECGACLPFLASQPRALP